MADQKLPPQNIDAEENVLGAMMIAPSAVDAAVDAGLQASDFYRESHGVIFDALVGLWTRGEPTDVVSLVARMETDGSLARVGGSIAPKDRLIEIATLAPAATNVRHHAEIVRRLAILRRLANAGAQIYRLAMDGVGETTDLLDQSEGLIFEVASTRRSGDFVTIRETVREAFTQIEEVAKNGSTVVGVPSGLRALDRFTAGFQPGNLVLVAARPSMGKTGLALSIAAHVAVREKLPVAVFSMEMSRSEVTQRLLASEGLVESEKIRNGQLNGEEWSRLANAGSRLDPSLILIDDSGDVTALELRSKARKLKLRHPALGMILVDYLQLMTSGGRAENRNQDVSQISRSLKGVANELKVPVVALSQLSRNVEQRHDRRPILSDLRESGALEQDADVVLFIYRDEYYNPEDTDQQGIAEIEIAKHRNGPTGTVKVSFVKRFVKFADLPRPGAGDVV